MAIKMERCVTVTVSELNDLRNRVERLAIKMEKYLKEKESDKHPTPLPCPFCESDRIDDTNCFGNYWICCYDCGSNGPRRTDLDEAIRGWNDRSPGGNDGNT